MKQYICSECGKIYTEDNVPGNFICVDVDCPGDGLSGLISEIEGPPTPVHEVGLCILLMDASGSMEDPAFKNQAYPSKYNPANALSKREIITDNAAKAIFELLQMLKKDDAYITVMKFDHRQEEIFTKSVAQIQAEYATAGNLAKYLYDQLAAMNGGTNINAALNMAYAKAEQFLAREMAELGDYIPLSHTQFSPALNKALDIPNVRVLMYTDGEQLPEFGAITNPFKKMQPDLLMGVYIGADGEKGCEDLKGIISKCPVHNAEQFFVLDNPQKIATLRGLFRMASGASGFCPACIGTIKPR